MCLSRNSFVRSSAVIIVSVFHIRFAFFFSFFGFVHSQYMRDSLLIKIKELTNKVYFYVEMKCLRSRTLPNTNECGIYMRSIGWTNGRTNGRSDTFISVGYLGRRKKKRLCNFAATATAAAAAAKAEALATTNDTEQNANKINKRK